MLNSGEKHYNFVFSKLSLFHFKNAANKLKQNVVRKITLESVGKHWNPNLNRVWIGKWAKSAQFLVFFAVLKRFFPKFHFVRSKFSYSRRLVG